MLVISRKRNERVIIGDQVITIQVVDIRGDKVRLGITAPKSIPVHREEVYHCIQREGERRNGSEKTNIESIDVGSLPDDNAQEHVSSGHAEENTAAQE